jgi:hypothetical protein
MNRRSILKGLVAAPIAAALPIASPKTGAQREFGDVFVDFVKAAFEYMVHPDTPRSGALVIGRILQRIKAQLDAEDEASAQSSGSSGNTAIHNGVVERNRDDPKPHIFVSGYLPVADEIAICLSCKLKDCAGIENRSCPARRERLLRESAYRQSRKAAGQIRPARRSSIYSSL